MELALKRKGACKKAARIKEQKRIKDKNMSMRYEIKLSKWEAKKNGNCQTYKIKFRDVKFLASMFSSFSIHSYNSWCCWRDDDIIYENNFHHRRLFYIHHFCLIYGAANDILTYDSCWFHISSSIKHSFCASFLSFFSSFHSQRHLMTLKLLWLREIKA